jgi:probable HAF family extracellular repeat protein
MVGIGDISGGSFETWATGVSADGSVIVVNGGALGNPDRIFRWTQSTGIISLGFRSSEAFDVSDDGSVIVGRAFTNNTNQAFRWTQSGTIIIGDLPGGGVVPFSSANAVSADGSVVVGRGVSVSGDEAFRWTQTTGIVGLGDLPGGIFNSSATAVSANGSIVVGRGGVISVNNSEAFRWTQATGMVGLGDLPGGSFNSIAWGVSADGSVVVGTGSTANGINAEAFIWDSANGMRSIQQILTNDFGLDLTGWRLSSANDISADGLTIVGSGINPNGQSEAWIAKLDSALPPTTPSPVTSISPNLPSGTPGVNFLPIGSGTNTWYVGISPNSLAGQVTGSQPFAPNGRIWDVPHGTGRSRVNGNRLSMSMQPPSELFLNGVSISRGTFNVTSAIAYLTNGSTLTLTVPAPISAIIGDTTEHFLFDTPLDTEVIRFTGFFDPSEPNLDPANFDLTVGSISDGNADWTVYLPSMTNMTTYQVTDLNNDQDLNDDTNYFLGLDNPQSVPEGDNLVGLLVLAGGYGLKRVICRLSER